MAIRSLSFRVIASSFIWVILALVLTAMLLVFLFHGQTSRHYDKHVTLHLEELLEAASATADGELQLEFEPSDPRFQVADSGWYWEVKRGTQSLRRSASLGGHSLDLGPIEPAETVSIHETGGPRQTMVRLHVLSKVPKNGSEPLLFLATAPMTGIMDDVRNFAGSLAGAFVLLGVCLLAAVILQVRIALKPLRAIGTGISAVREGKADRLPEHDYPGDVQPLIDELNNLLEHNAVLLKRARNQLGDLAHAIKNPLTVINNEARTLEPGQKDLISQQIREISKNVDHYLARARTFGSENVLGSRAGVKDVVEGLLFAMQRIHQQRGLEFYYSCLNDCFFRGERQDMEEMLGNLVDNACKWAGSRVFVSSEKVQNRLRLLVEDDGPGIPEAEIERVMLRGHKLDESKPGHGQGLGIVRELADLYGGSLKLSPSKMGGLKAELILPAA